jgi:chitinase
VRVTVTTTIIIPPITTTEIEVWGRSIENTDTDTTDSSSFFVTSSIRPPIITITDEPDQTETGRPPHTRTIHPPPWPYIRPDRTSSDGPSFPIVTYKPGPPGPRCISPPSICGHPCLIFCDTPCSPLLCPGPGIDFPDPIAPPPPEVAPTSTPPGNEPPEDEENDQDEEDDEESCEAEFNLPPGGSDQGSPSDPDPTYLSGSGGTTRTPDPTIAPAPAPPTPSPPPPPDPPKPNPDTEDRKCYDSGALTGRGDAIKAVENFCEAFDGTVLDDSVVERREVAGIDEAVGGFVSIVQSVTVRNGCKFNFDRQQCRRIMRRMLDECDTTSTRFKQGGTVEDNCSIWRLDPQVDIASLLCWIPLYRAGDYLLNDGEDC